MIGSEGCLGTALFGMALTRTLHGINLLRHKNCKVFVLIYCDSNRFLFVPFLS
jgi:hypothetical protein